MFKSDNKRDNGIFKLLFFEFRCPDKFLQRQKFDKEINN